nr:cadherin domain-containing protein [Psychrobium sp. MM17-31]
MVGITAFAEDTDTGDTVTYSLSGVNKDLFSIDASSGVIRVADGFSTDATSLDVIVVATSTDKSSSSETFTIAINQDVGPLIDENDDANNVAEDAEVGSEVGITALAKDANDEDVVTYALSAADQTAGLFAIDATTGVVTVAGSLDHEDASSHSITVIATSADGSTSSDSFTINVTDVNEAISELKDDNDDANTVAENAAAGTTVGITALATDQDDSVTYALSAADQAAGLFAIDATTGVVTVKGSFDHEDASSHSITVIATSADGSTSSDSFTINVTDVNEAISELKDDNDDANTVAENAAAGTTVGITALATDQDEDDSVTYALSAADQAAGLFAIDATTGVVTVAGSLDHEDASSHSITVIATSADGSTSSDSFTINVTDVNEAISELKDDNDDANTVAENAAAGTTVGITALATDQDEDDSVTYALSAADQAAGLFAIDATTGVVTVAGSLDHEDASSHSITVIATSADGSTSSNSFTINVTDVNEAISALEDDNDDANSVAENAAAGTTVGITALATDEDATDTVSYALSAADQTAGLFAIDATTGVVTVKGSLDHEDASSHNITVIATSADGSTSSDSFTINVTDVNEAISELKDNNDDANTVAENAAAGTTVGITALATDEDATDTVSYALSAADQAAGLFAIDATTGVVTIAGSLDHEDASSHSITVIATSADGSTSSDSFTINVTDVNEAIGTLTDSNTAADSVAENATVGTTVGITALATDQDEDDSVTYALSAADQAAGLFAIDATTGVVTVAGSLDHEDASSHSITVIATSADGSTSSNSFTINVTDVNEAISALEDDNDDANSVAENAAASTTVGITALATDEDATDTVSYALSAADQTAGLFAIDATTGVVTVAGSLDHEDASSHSITVIATSADGSTSSDSFTINVTDVNEAISELKDNNDDANTVAENAAAGTTVGITALATDQDEDDSVTYALTAADQAAGLFAIDAISGVVTVAGSLDHEDASSHSITVIATSADGSTSSNSFTINVTDVNEAISELKDDNDDANTVAENAAAGTTVGITALATDQDEDDSVTYALSAADQAAGLFAIDATTGVVTIAGSLDHEDASSHSITVIATSADGSTSSNSFTINVTDVNEAISELKDDNDDANTVAENAAAGTTVGITALATDQDEDDSVTYALSAADQAAGLFAIDATSGVVTVAGALDHETAPQHTVTVIATSTDGSTVSDSFTINVTDVNEAIGTLTDSNTAADSVAENATVGTTVGITALATDQDEDDSVTYALSAADEAAGLFAIDATSGVVTVAGALDHETAPSHTVTVIATSTDGSTSSDSFTINVTDVNESPVATNDNFADFQLIAKIDENRGVQKFQAFDALDGYSNSVSTVSVGTDGRFASVWRTDNSDNDASIYVQSFNADGSPNTAVNPATGGMIKLQATGNVDGQNYHPAISAIGDSGAFAVTWMGEEPESGDFSIYLQLFNADGTLNHSPNGTQKLEAFDNTSGEDRLPRITSVGNNGDFVVVWTGEDEQGDHSVSYAKFDINGEIYAPGIQKLEVAGNLAMDDFTTSVTALGDDGSFAIGYIGTDLEGDTSGYVQTFDASLGKLSLNKLETPDSTTINENGTQIASIGNDGSYVVVWSSTQGSFGNEVYSKHFVQRFNADGSPHASGIQELSDDYPELARADANVVALGDSGAYAITWTVGLSDINTSAKSFVQFVGPNGDLGATSPTQLQAPFMQSGNEWPTITPLDDGGFVVTWIGEVVGDRLEGFFNYIPGQTFVFTQKFNADGTIDTSPSPETNGVILVESYDASRVINLIPDTTAVGTDGAYVVTWPSLDKDGNVAIYTQSFDENGVKIQENPASPGVYKLNVLANDFDQDTGDQISIWKIADQDATSGQEIDIFQGGELVGTARIESNEIVFTPGASLARLAEGEKLSISFEYTIRDSENNSDTDSTATVTFNVIGADDASVIVDDLVTTQENETLNGNVLTNDSDVDNTLIIETFILPGDTTIYQAGNTGTIENVGTFTLNSDGSYTFVPEENYSGNVPQIHYYTNTGARGALNITVVNGPEVGAISDEDASGDSDNHKLSENAVVGTEVGITAFAEDPDDEVTYSLADNDGGLFAIDATSGVVTLVGNVDYETDKSHKITVQANSEDGSTSTKVFTIDIGDNNDGNGGEGTTGDTDNAVTQVHDSDDVIASLVSENAPIGTYVGMTAFAEDADGDKVTYSLIDVGIDEQGRAKFAVDADTGEITVAGNLDFEKENLEEITMVATSEDGSTSTQQVIIVIHNNEQGIGGTGTTGDTDNAVSAITDSDNTIGKVSENAIAGTKVGITAFADDSDRRDDVAYSIVGDAGPFVIDASTGVITVTGNLNYETQDTYQLKVLATSKDSSTSTHTFTIEVDNNENGLGGEGTSGDTDRAVDQVRDSDDVIVSLVSENATIGTYVGLTAFADDPDGDKVTYSLINVGVDEQGREKFVVDENTGEITVAGNLDFEKENFEAITMVATSEDGSTSTQQVTVVIHNNEKGIGGEGTQGDTDNAVSAIEDKNTAANIIVENATVGSEAGITAFANDLDNGDEVTYKLSDADIAAGLFAIDANSGVVTVVGNLNFETQQSHDITVIATSEDQSSATKNFVITVSDINEAPVITEVESFTAVEETAQLNQIVARIIAIDPDTDELTFSITQGNELGYVTIDSDSGEITLTQAGIDALNDNAGNITTLSLTVQVSDGDLFTQQPVVITLDEMVAPTIEIASSSDTGESDSDGITSQNKPIFAGNGEIGATIVLTIDGTEIGRGVVQGDGTYTIISATTLDDGEHTVVVTATDSSNNEKSAPLSITIDTQGVGAISVDPVTDNNIIDKDEVGTQITITGSASGEFATGDSVTTTINGTQYSGVISSDGNSWSIENVSTDDIIADNEFSIQANGSDVAGNAISHAQTVTVEIYENNAPVAVDDDTVVVSSTQVLVEETFGSGTTGWQNQKLNSGRLKVENGTTSSKVFDFGPEHAGETVTISFRAKGNKNWDGGADDIKVYFNDVKEIDDSYTNGNWHQYNDIAVTLDAQGRVKLAFEASTNANNEDLLIDNVVIKTGDDYTSNITTDEDSALTIDVLANDSDADGDALTITHLNGTELTNVINSVEVLDVNGMLAGHISVVDGKVVFTPDVSLNSMAQGEELALSFTYSISDGDASDNATASFVVAGTNDLPVITQVETQVENSVQSIVIATITDIDGDLDLDATNASAQNGTVSINANGEVIYTPNTNFSGIESITITAIDEAGAIVPQTISLNVMHVNHAPVAVDDTFGALEDVSNLLSATNYTGNVSYGQEIAYQGIVGKRQQIEVLNENGDFAMTWQVIANGQTKDSIAVQMFNSEGDAISSVVLMDTVGLDDEDNLPRITALGDSGEFVVSWQGKEHTSQGSDYSIFTQQFNADGTISGHERHKFESGPTNAADKYQQITSIGDNGEYVMVWYGNVGGNYYHFLQEFDSNGEPSGSATRLEPAGAPLGSEFKPDITEVGNDGSYVVTWVGTSGGKRHVYTQKFNNDGSSADVVSYQADSRNPDYNQATSTVTEVGTDGSYVLVWSNYTSVNRSETYFQRFDAEGEPVSNSPTKVDQQGTKHNDYNPQVVALGDSGNFALVWEETNGTESLIYIKAYNADGSAMRTEAITLDGFTNVDLRNANPSITNIGTDGDFVIAWESEADSSDNYAVFVQRFNNLGLPVGEMVQLDEPSTTWTNQIFKEPQVFANGNDGAFNVVWRGHDDTQYTSLNIQGFDANGQRIGDFGNSRGDFDITLDSEALSAQQVRVTYSTGQLMVNGEAVASGSLVNVDEWNNVQLVNAKGKDYDLKIEAVSADEIGQDEIQLLDVLANDSDPNNDPLSIVEINGQDVSQGQEVDITVSGEVIGTASVVNNQIRFVPSDVLHVLPEGEIASYSFDYRIADDKALKSEIAQVTFNVIGTNDAPIVEFTHTDVVRDGDVVIVGNVRDIDSELDFSKTTISADSGVVTIDESTGDILYTAQGNAEQAQITINAFDEQGAKTKVVHKITIEIPNSAPVAQDDDFTTRDEMPLRVNSDTSGIREEYSDIAVLNDGSYVVTWSTFGSSGGVFFKHFDANGNALTDSELVHQYGRESSPSITAAADGGFVIAYQGSSGIAQFKRYNSDAEQIGVGEQSLTYSLDEYKNQLEIMALDEGGFAAVYEHWGAGSIVSSDVRFELVDADGNVTLTDVVITNDDNIHDMSPQLAQLNNGSFVVTWLSWQEDGWQIQQQRLSSDGSKIGGVTEVSTTNYTGDSSAVNVNKWPVVSELQDGGYIIAWYAMTEYSGQISGDNIYQLMTQRFDKGGQKVGGEKVVSDGLMNIGTDITQLSIDTLANGNLVVVYASETMTDEANIFVRVIDKNGTAVSQEIQINPDSDYAHKTPSVKSLDDGGFIVTWALFENDEEGDIFTKRFDASGVETGAKIIYEEDAPIVLDVLANDSDVDNDTLVITQINGQDVSSGQTVEVTNNKGKIIGTASVINGKIEFIPGEEIEKLKQDQLKDFSFEYTISDGEATDSATVSFTVRGSENAVPVVQDDKSTWVDISDEIIITGFDNASTGIKHEDDTSSRSDGDLFDYAAVGNDGTSVLIYGGSDTGKYYVQRINADGTKNGNAVELKGSSTLAIMNFEPKITAIGNSGDYAVTFIGQKNNGSKAVYAQKYSADGDTVGALQKVDIDTAGISDSKVEADVPNTASNFGKVSETQTFTELMYGNNQEAELANGNIVRVWTAFDGTSGNQYNNTVFARVYSKDGQPLADEFEVNQWQGQASANAKKSFSEVVVSASADGGFNIFWHSYNQSNFESNDPTRDTSDISTDLMVRSYDSSGNAVTDEVALESYQESGHVSYEYSSSSRQTNSLLLANGNTLVSWVEPDEFTNQPELKTMILDSDLNVVHDEVGNLSVSLHYYQGKSNSTTDYDNSVEAHKFDTVSDIRVVETADNLLLYTASGYKRSANNGDGESSDYETWTWVIDPTTNQRVGDTQQLTPVQKGISYHSVGLAFDPITKLYASFHATGNQLYRTDLDAQGNIINASYSVGSLDYVNYRTGHRLTESSIGATIDSDGNVVAFYSYGISNIGSGHYGSVISKIFPSNGGPATTTEHEYNYGMGHPYEGELYQKTDGTFSYSFSAGTGVTANIHRWGGSFVVEGAAGKADSPIVTEANEVFITSTQQDGSYAVLFTSVNPDTSTLNVYTQAFKANGKKDGIAKNITPNDLKDGNVADIALIESDNSFALSFQRGEQAYIQLLNQALAKYNAPISLGEQTSDVTIIASQNGEFLAAYQSGVDKTAAIEVKRFDSEGEQLGNTIVLNTKSSGKQVADTAPNITELTDGSFVVVWSGAGTTSTTDDIYVARFDRDGNELSRVRMNTSAKDDQLPSVTGIGDDGEFVVAWHSDAIYSQKFSADGNKVGNKVKAGPLDNLNVDAENVHLIALPDGRFAISFESDGSLYTQTYNANGSKSLIIENKTQIGDFELADLDVADINTVYQVQYTQGQLMLDGQEVASGSEITAAQWHNAVMKGVNLNNFDLTLKQSISLMTDENTPIRVNVLANDTDLEGDALSIVTIDGQDVSHGQTVEVTDNKGRILGSARVVNGEIEFTPGEQIHKLTPGQTKEYNFDYTVTDGKSESAPATVVFLVEGAEPINQSVIAQNAEQLKTPATPDSDNIGNNDIAFNEVNLDTRGVEIEESVNIIGLDASLIDVEHADEVWFAHENDSQQSESSIVDASDYENLILEEQESLLQYLDSNFDEDKELIQGLDNELEALDTPPPSITDQEEVIVNGNKDGVVLQPNGNSVDPESAQSLDDLDDDIV